MLLEPTLHHLARLPQTRSRRAVLRDAVSATMGISVVAACVPNPVRLGEPRPSERSGAPSPTSGGAPVTLEMWLPGRQADADALAPFHQEFVAELPRVAGVNVRLVTNEAMMEQLTATLAAGNPPDVARLKEYRLADLGARDALLPLDAPVAKDPHVRLADFTPQSIEGSRAAVPGQKGNRTEQALLGLPDSHQIVVLFWNKDLLAQAGLDPAQPPASWDALRRAARAVAGLGAGTGSGGNAETGGDRAGGQSRQSPWGFQFYEFSMREQVYCWFMEWVWRAGGEVWSDQVRNGQRRNDPAIRRARLDTPEAFHALQFHVDLIHGDRVAVPPGTPVPELIANVAQGRTGYWMTTANAALTYERTAPGLRFGIGPLPPDRRDAHQLQHNALSIFKASRAPDAAYALISFRSRADVQARWAAGGAWIPVRPALWNRAPFNQDDRWRAIGALVHRLGNRPKPVVPEWEAFTTVVLPHLLAAWRGEEAPKHALAAAEREGNAHLEARG
ncbi:MAG: extracellular solute-binding protein [Chloroflexi bacterium]|nr:extracellular solute-binding protein [Chloroflexota bacterium]